MAKRVRWGRVGLAATATSIAACAGLSVLTEPVNPHEAEGRLQRTEFQVVQESLRRSDEMAVESPDRALDLAMDALELGSLRQLEGGVVQANVGTAIMMQATDHLAELLADPRLSDAELNEAWDRLTDLAVLRIDHRAMATEQRSQDRESAWALARAGRVVGAAITWTEAERWVARAESTPRTWRGGLRLEQRGQAEDDFGRLFVDTLMDGDAVRVQVSALAMLVAMNLSRRQTAECPPDLQGEGPFLYAPHAYDADRCELIVSPHPEWAPVVYRLED